MVLYPAGSKYRCFTRVWRLDSKPNLQPRFEISIHQSQHSIKYRSPGWSSWSDTECTNWGPVRCDVAMRSGGANSPPGSTISSDNGGWMADGGWIWCFTRNLGEMIQSDSYFSGNHLKILVVRSDTGFEKSSNFLFG